MIKMLLLKPPNGSVHLISPDGFEIPMNADGEFDITQFPELASRYPHWELKRVEE